MFPSTRNPARDSVKSANWEGNAITLLLPSVLPESYALEDLYRELVKGNEEGQDEELENLLILASCLKESDRLKATDDGKWYEKLEDYLAKIILPDGKVFSLDETDDEEELGKAHKIKQYRGKYTLGILSISNLLEISSNPSPPPKDSTILSLLPFTATTNPWAASQSQQIATAILEKYSVYIHSSGFLVTYLLQSFIRPIFSKTPPPRSVTASSRKAAPSSAPPRHFDIRESSPSRQPWRSSIPYTIPVLQWIIEHISPDILRTQAFPLLIPPLLTLLDSSSNSIRVHTLRVIPILFSKMGDKLLLQTGLGDVFEDAIHPLLLFLPSLTPVEDTLKLLPAGYNALYALCDARWPEKKDADASESLAVSINKPSKPTPSTSPSPAQLRLAFLDRIIRHALLPAHLHCQEIPSVVEILVSQIGLVIPRMGIWGVRHLKDILPIISNILINPFLPDTTPSLVLKTLETLRDVILVLWPRISVEEHRLSILQALAVSYGNIRLQSGEKSEEKKRVHEEILKEQQETGKVFVAAVRGADDAHAKQTFEQELVEVIGANGELASVFRVN
ncbi:hypothetical protein DSL72_003230 [Monilinia vaccinii-corymbosi]|uniref:Uncharacterized protein n=1 Tax=Monilinia vaccinii-corymbosi TaxID=61207 RepID=A0A8A3P5I3_9HELO|nr:hypothetical protein DSL72_003230 [Monilinia vaccinii-corymbosi]